MPSTVNRRCVVYIFTCAPADCYVEVSWILLNKGYNMLNNIKNLR